MGALSGQEYAAAIAGLDEWVRWLVAVYRIDYQSVPDCWARHPDLREDLGHLWTGWLMTRHPQAGVGSAGLEWDQRRDAAIGRCRTATARAGCTPSSRHRANAGRSWPG